MQLKFISSGYAPQETIAKVTGIAWSPNNRRLAIVTTDRVSAFDVILPTPIPGKGEVLTQLSAYWFDLLDGIVPHHLVTVAVDEMGPDVAPHRDVLRGRSMLVKRAQALPVECVDNENPTLRHPYKYDVYVYVDVDVAVARRPAV